MNKRLPSIQLDLYARAVFCSVLVLVLLLQLLRLFLFCLSLLFFYLQITEYRQNSNRLLFPLHEVSLMRPTKRDDHQAARKRKEGHRPGRVRNQGEGEIRMRQNTKPESTLHIDAHQAEGGKVTFVTRVELKIRGGGGRKKTENPIQSPQSTINHSINRYTSQLIDKSIQLHISIIQCIQ